MRVLVVDQDSALLTAITRLLGEYFTIDAVTTKADCLDLVRVNEFDVIVAGERLEDGSGLELLSQIARSCPDILRIFSVEPDRLKLLKGRLGPFGLFRTLPYPIEPRQLLAALSAAAGIVEGEGEEDDDSGAELAAEFDPGAPAPHPEPVQPERVAANTWAAVSSAPTPARLAPHLETPTRVSAVATASVTGRKPIRAATPAPSPPARQSTGHPDRRSPTRANSPEPPAASGGTRQARHVRQPTPEALALGARLAATSRPRAKGFAPPSLEASAQRSAFAIGAGVALVLGGLILALRLFSPATLHSTSLASTQTPAFPPEVLKLVADTETDFQLDDLKAARTDIAALQQLAPTHPGLHFFESQLARREAEAAAAKVHTPAPKHAPLVKAASPGPAQIATPPVRRRPSGGATFSGTTLEDTSFNAPQPKPLAASGASATSSPTHEPRIIQPRVIERVAAEYPEDAARDGVEGAVDLSFLISPQGEVRDVTILHAEPSNIFNRAAISAVRRWKYEPKTVAGVPVEARVQLRLTFKLDARSR